MNLWSLAAGINQSFHVMKHSLLLSIPTIIFSLLVSTSCKDTKSIKQKEQEKNAIEDLQKAAEEMNRQQAKELESTGGISNNPSVMNSTIEATRKLEAASTGDEAKGAKVMRVFMEGLQQDMAKLSSLQQGLEQATNYATIKTPEDIDEQSVKVKNYQEANAELTAKIKSGWIAQLRINLEKEGLKESYINEFIRGAQSSIGANKADLLLVRQMDDQLCDAIFKQHAILKKHLGKWQWNATAGALDFEDNIALENYNQQAIRIQKIAEKQTAAQKRLLKVK